MKYEPVGQTLVMMRPTSSKDFKENPEMKKTKRNLLIVLTIQLLLATALFILQIITIIRHYTIAKQYGYLIFTPSYTNNIVLVCISMIFYIIYTIAVVKYSRTGILVFTWINLTALIIALVTIIIRFIIVFAFSTSSVRHSAFEIIIPISVIFILSMVQILIIKFSFNFAKLIKILKTYQITEN